MARTILPPPGGGTNPPPDVPNYSWYDYGLRVGIWRLKEVLDRYGMKATVSLNGSVCSSYPRLVEAMVKADWELLGHSYIQRPMAQEKDQAGMIQQTIAALRAASGKSPRGWMGPGLTETWETPDRLAAAGIEYVCDWVNDDLSYDLRVKSGSLVSLPYTVELNDIPIFLLQHHPSEELLRRTRDQFDTLYAEGQTRPRCMAIAVHPYITGVPHRIKYFEQALQYLTNHTAVVFWKGEEILDWYLHQTTLLNGSVGITVQEQGGRS